MQYRIHRSSSSVERSLQNRMQPTQNNPLLLHHHQIRFQSLKNSWPGSKSAHQIRSLSYPGEPACLEKLSVCLSEVVPSHYTQIHGGGEICVYKLREYEVVRKCLKNSEGIECEEINYTTLNVIQRLSQSVVEGRWSQCVDGYLSDEDVDKLMGQLPKSLLDVLLPFQVEGVQFVLCRGGQCLVADEMGLGKTLQRQPPPLV